MTAIVGLVDKGTVYMGGDSCAGDAQSCLKTRMKHPKVFRKGEFIIGYTSSFRMGQLLECELTPPEMPENITLYDYMVRLFVPALRGCLKGGGFAKVENNVEEGGTFLVGIRECLFEIQSDYSVLDHASEYMACGCGREYCLGSLHSTHGWQPKDRIIAALTAAAEYNAYVMSPFTVESLEFKGGVPPDA